MENELAFYALAKEAMERQLVKEGAKMGPVQTADGYRYKGKRKPSDPNKALVPSDSRVIATGREKAPGSKWGRRGAVGGAIAANLRRRKKPGRLQRFAQRVGLSKKPSRLRRAGNVVGRTAKGAAAGYLLGRGGAAAASKLRSPAIDMAHSVLKRVRR